MTDAFHIIKGQEYLYLGTIPAKCRGHRYRVVEFVMAIPVYQPMVLVECLSGPDKGMFIVCSEANFASRYELVEETK